MSKRSIIQMSLENIMSMSIIKQEKRRKSKCEEKVF